MTNPRLTPSLLAALAALASPALAYAQQPPQAAPPPGSAAPQGPSSSPEVSPEEKAALEKALGADLQAQAQRQAQAQAQPPVAAGPATVPAPGGFSLQSLNPDLSFIADVALAAFDAKDPSQLPILQAGGHDPQKTGFNLQALELAVSKAVDPYFRFDANIVFGNSGVEIEEAYATTLGLPYQLQARVGKFLTRFGRINASHPHTWDFSDQPFMISRIFGGEGNRGLGAELSWLTPLPWYVELVGSVTDASSEGATRSFIPDAGTLPNQPSDFRVRGPLDFVDVLALKQFFALSDDLSLMWGLSAAFGPNVTGAALPNPTGTQTFSQIYGTDLYLKYRPLSGGSTTILSLQAEGYYRRRQLPEDALGDFGGYAYAFWRFEQRWGAAVRYEYGSPSFNRAGTIADDYLDPFWTANRQRISANLTFWPTEFSRIRLQGSADLLGWQDRPNYAAFLTFEFAVGAHGAHRF